jgi:hypothetical protein
VTFGGSASSLDVDFGSLDFGISSSPRKRRRVPSSTASTIVEDFIALDSSEFGSSSIGLAQVFEIVTDDAAQKWIGDTQRRAIVDVVAKQFARCIGVDRLEIRHESEAEEPLEQRVHLVAQVPGSSMFVLEKLFNFVSDPWWIAVVRSTQGTIVVDVEFL